MTAQAGLILLAHGARDPRWAAPFEAVAAQVQQQRPQVLLRLAYLDFIAPTLPEAGAQLAQAGCSHIDVLPLFLGAGGHVRKDVPQLLQQLRASFPALRCTLHGAVGEHPALIRTMADLACALLDPA